MEAGRELDVMIAEKVMGWSWNKECNCWNYANGCPVGYVFNPSTDISAAWEVVEKLNLMHPFGLFYRTLSLDKLWEARFGYPYESSDYKKYFAAMSSSVPHAICLAALKAIGHRDDGPMRIPPIN